MEHSLGLFDAGNACDMPMMQENELISLASLFKSALSLRNWLLRFVVDVTQQVSFLLVAGGRELALAKVAFPGRPLREAKHGLKAPGPKRKVLEMLSEGFMSSYSVIPLYSRTYNDFIQS